MRTKGINFKRIFSYLLIFTVFFTSIQMGSIMPAKAMDVNQVPSAVPGLIMHEGDLASISTNRVIKVDRENNDGGAYICRYLPMGGFNLTPESGYNIIDVKSSTDKMTVTPSTLNNGNAYSINNIKDYSDFTLTVTMQHGTDTPVVYPIEMKFQDDPSLNFSTLKVTFDNNDTTSYGYSQTDLNGNYSVGNIPSSVKTAKIELIKDGNPMTFTINGSSDNTVNLVGGDNVVAIGVSNGSVSKEYTLILTKKGEAKLQSLIPSTGTLAPAFSGDTNEYTMTVPTDQSKITFTPTAVDNSSTIKVNGISVASGSKSQNIKLDEGDNEVNIVLTTKDGDTNTYTVTVTRTAQFRSSQLTALALTTGSFTPAFNKGIYEYTVIVDNDVTSIGVTPTAEDPNATIMVNSNNYSKKVPSGATSPYISLDEGGNSINVKVTDTNGNSSTYALNVTRRYSKDNVNLASLSVTDGTMSPKFDPETYLYSVKVAKSIEKVRILYTLENDKAKIKINGKEYTNGQSDYIKLDLGANIVTIEITAEDGTTTTTYKLSVIRGEVKGNNQWVLVAGNWTFYNAEGIQVKNEWAKYDNQWYFLDINGYRKSGWLNESGKWYFLNDDGIMMTGWQYNKGYWYYLQGDGAMRSNCWATYDGKWYFFNKYGQMQTGWTLYAGKWYYMDEHGAMQKGWVTNDKNKYYLNDDGTMRTGWMYNSKVWYYLDSSGIMIRGWKTIDGRNYYFDANGVMKTGMMFLDGQWINLNNV